MKKNVMMRIAALLMVCVLATTCGISGTFAKYVTSDNAEDSARVAKWGVEVGFVSDSMLKTEYANSENILTVKSSNDDKIVAPGTSGEATFTISGKPEVSTKISIETTYQDIYWNDYHPLKWTLTLVSDASEGVSNVELKVGTLKDIMDYLQTYVSAAEYGPGEDLGATFKLSWEWVFEQDNDFADTRLGDLVAEYGAVSNDNYSTALNYGITITIEQVD